MATLVFQDYFPRDLVRARHAFASDTFLVGLSNTAIAQSVQDTTGVTPISTGNGWSGPVATTPTITDASADTCSVAFSDPSLVTASGGSVGPFRYGYLYNDTTSPKRLIATVDFGSAITLTAGNSFQIDFSGQAITVNNPA